MTGTERVTADCDVGGKGSGMRARTLGFASSKLKAGHSGEISARLWWIDCEKLWCNTVQPAKCRRDPRRAGKQSDLYYNGKFPRKRSSAGERTILGISSNEAEQKTVDVRREVVESNSVE